MRNSMTRTLVTASLLAVAGMVALDGDALAQRNGRGAQYPPPRGPGHERYGGPMEVFEGPIDGPPGPPRGFRPPSLEDLERAGVTAAQRAKIEELHDGAMRRMIQIRADLGIAELDVRKSIENDHPDTNAVDAAIDRVGALRTALHKAQVHEMLAVRALLTPEQRAKLKSMAPERR